MRQVKKRVLSDGRIYTLRSNRNRFFFPDEWMAFYDKLKPSQKMTFEFLINTGARIMEAQHVKVQDIDIDRGNVVLRKTKAVRKGRKGETQSKIRILPISSKFAKYLKKYIREANLGPQDTLKILSTPAANIAMKKALKEAGIEDWDMFSIHNIRKTLETWIIALDVDSLKIIKHFGHTLQVASQHYVAPDVFSWEDKQQIRQIIGDLYVK